MRLLIADDDAVARQLLLDWVSAWGYEAVLCADGQAAWDHLKAEPELAMGILDWEMPGLTGPGVCRRVRAELAGRPLHLILITGTHAGVEAVVEGFAAGADDYLAKPFEPRELRARLRVGERLVTMERMLVQRVQELETALAKVKRLQGLLPICAFCKRVRDDHDYWQEVETYLAEHAVAEFSHSLCPACARTYFPDHATEILAKATITEKDKR